MEFSKYKQNIKINIIDKGILFINHINSMYCNFVNVILIKRIKNKILKIIYYFSSSQIRFKAFFVSISNKARERILIILLLKCKMTQLIKIIDLTYL